MKYESRPSWTRQLNSSYYSINVSFLLLQSVFPISLQGQKVGGYLDIFSAKKRIILLVCRHDGGLSNRRQTDSKHALLPRSHAKSILDLLVRPTAARRGKTIEYKYISNSPPAHKYPINILPILTVGYRILHPFKSQYIMVLMLSGNNKCLTGVSFNALTGRPLIYSSLIPLTLCKDVIQL